MLKSSRLSRQAGYSIASALVVVAVLGLSAIAIENTFPEYQRESLAAAGGVLAQAGSDAGVTGGGYTPPPTGNAASDSSAGMSPSGSLTNADLDKAMCEEKKKEAIANGGISKSSTQPFTAGDSVENVTEKNRCISAMYDKDSEAAKTPVGSGYNPMEDPKAYKCIGETATVDIGISGTGSISSKPNPALNPGQCRTVYCDAGNLVGEGCSIATKQFTLNGYTNHSLGALPAYPDVTDWNQGMTLNPNPLGTTPSTGYNGWATLENPSASPLNYFGGGSLPNPATNDTSGYYAGPATGGSFDVMGGVYSDSAGNVYGLPPADNSGCWDGTTCTNQPQGGLTQTPGAGQLPPGWTIGQYGRACPPGDVSPGCPGVSGALPPGWTTGQYGRACPPGDVSPGCPGSAGTTFTQQRPGTGIFGGSTMGTLGGYQQPSLLQSLMGGLMQGLFGNSAMGGMPTQECSKDPAIYAQQQQQYQMQMQQYQYQMQQYQYQQQMQQFYARSGQQYQPSYMNPMMPQQYPYQMGSLGYGQTSMYGQPYGMPQMPQPCSQAGSGNGLLGQLLNNMQNNSNSNNGGSGGSGNGGGSNGNQCPNPPQQPSGASCSTGYWKAVYSGDCLTNWQCTPVSQLKAEISCQPNIADAGMTLAISYACTSGTASSNAFQATTQPAGTATVLVATPPIGANTATYSMTCTDGARTAVAQCSVQVANPTITFAANPASVQASSTSVLGWITSGMKSCVVSSPDQADFTARNAGITSPNGTAVSSAISSSTRFVLQCETHAGGTRSASTTVGLLE